MDGISIPEVAKDLIINIINIIVLFVIVRALVYKPVKKFLSARTERIEEKERQAEEKAKKAEEAVAGYEKLLEDSKAKGEEIISEAEHTAKQNSQQILESAREDARSIIAKSRSDMDAEHTAMISSMQEEITGLAVDIAGRILKREFNDEDNIKIAAEFFSDENIKAKNLLTESAERVDQSNKEAFNAEKAGIASLAVDISGKILSHSVTDDDNLKIAEGFFEENDNKK